MKWNFLRSKSKSHERAFQSTRHLLGFLPFFFFFWWKFQVPYFCLPDLTAIKQSVDSRKRQDGHCREKHFSPYALLSNHYLNSWSVVFLTLIFTGFMESCHLCSQSSAPVLWWLHLQKVHAPKSHFPFALAMPSSSIPWISSPKALLSPFLTIKLTQGWGF